MQQFDLICVILADDYIHHQTMKKMKKLLLATFCTLLACTTVAQSTGTVTLNRFAGSKITGIEVSGPFTVNISQGAKSSFKIVVPKRCEDLLILEQDNDGQVEVYWKKGSNIRAITGDVFEIQMVCSTLQTIDCSGAVVMNLNGKINTQELDIDASGASKIEADDLTVTGKLSVDVSGANKQTLKGSAANCEIAGSGACKLDLSKFEVSNMDLDLSGAGKCSVWVTGNLSVDISGSGDVSYSGNPNLRKEISGAGRVTKL